jgi:hypothetical protein
MSTEPTLSMTGVTILLLALCLYQHRYRLYNSSIVCYVVVISWFKQCIWVDSEADFLLMSLINLVRKDKIVLSSWIHLLASLYKIDRRRGIWKQNYFLFESHQVVFLNWNMHILFAHTFSSVLWLKTTACLVNTTMFTE